jgi:hypothetical protein
MKCPLIKLGLLACTLLISFGAFAESPTAKELLDAHRASRKTLQDTLQENKQVLENQLTAELLKLDHLAQRNGELHLQLWTHGLLRLIEGLEDNWLAILKEPYELPGPIQQLLTTTEATWKELQSSAMNQALENKKNSLGTMEKLQIRLVQEDRIEEAVITRDLRGNLENFKEDEKLHSQLSKLTPEFYHKKIQQLKEKEFSSQDFIGPIPPPDALFPFQANNPTFKAYLKWVKAESSGYFATPSAHIQIGNNPVYSGFRGLALVAYTNGEIVLEDTFDTYAEQDESVRLSKAIADLPYGAFVVMAVRDDATRRFSGSTQSSLYRLGATTGILNLPYRSSYLLIGMKGLKMGDAVERFGVERQVYPFD